MNQTVEQLLKHLRASQPLNRIVTAATRNLLNSCGFKSELIVKHLHRLGSVQCNLPNGHVLLLESDGNDWIPNQLFWKGWAGYEPETLPLFFRLASTARVTLDIGAYIGLFALLAGYANSEGHVYAFEPLLNLYARVKRHVDLNSLRNVHCLNIALADFNGTTEIFHQPGNTCTASLSLEFMQWQPGWRSSVVTVATADQFVQEEKLMHVDLVKIDTESTEPQVLTGMLSTLERDHPNIICEVLPTFGVEKALIDILRPHGYYFYQLTDKGLIWRDSIEGSLEFKNYLFSTISPERISQIWR